jgi:hypothetical protein
MRKSFRSIIIWAVLLVLMASFSGSASAQGKASAGPKGPFSNSTETHSVKGVIKEKGKTLPNGKVFIQSINESRKLQLLTTDANGTFSTGLADGDYTVKAVQSQSDKKWFGTSTPFTVEKGKVKSEINVKGKKELKLPQAKTAQNVKGTLLDDGKGTKGEVVVYNLQGNEDEEILFLHSKNNGQFSAALQDGSYLVLGVILDDGIVIKEQWFTVTDGKVYVDGEQQYSLLIELPNKTYKASVTDSAASLANAEIGIARMMNEGEDYWYDYVQFANTNKKGEAWVRELADGSYAAVVYHSTFTGEMTTFEVVDGKLFVDGAQASSLDFKVPDISLKGTVQENKKPVGNVYLNAERQIEEDHYYSYHIQVDSKGNFVYRLPDGDYSITRIDENVRSTYVNIPFTIRDGKLLQNGKELKSLSIQLPPVTFQAKIMEQGKTFFGMVEVEKVFSEDNDEDWNYEWYYSETNEKGIASMRLPDGDYRVSYVYLYEEGDGIPLSQNFEIREGKLYVNGQPSTIFEVSIPPVTLQGVVMDGNVPVNGGDIVVSSLDDDFFYSWKWINADGTFTMRLADGSYLAREIYLYDGTNAFINIPFEIRDGKLYVNGEAADRLEISLPPVTLHGVLSDQGIPVEGEISLRTLSQNGEEHYFWTLTDENGSFKVRLPDGEYEVYTIHLYDGTIDNTLRKFSIVDGQLVVDGETSNVLDVHIAPITLTGNVTDGGQPLTDGYVSVIQLDEEGDWINSYHAWVSSDGSYSFRLPDGNYLLFYVDTIYEMYFFNKEFTMKDGKVFVNGKEAARLDLDLQDGSLEEYDTE